MTRPRPSQARPIRALVPVLAALALGACSESGAANAPPAATVAGTEIPAQALVDEVEAIAGNTPYVEAFETSAASSGSTLIVAGDGSGDELYTEFVTDTLAIRIQYEIVGQEVERQGIEVSEACTEASHQLLVDRFAAADASVDGESMLAGFGEDYADYLVERHAEFLALRADLAGLSCGAETSDEAVQAFFDANEEALTAEVACASHILVDTEEEADEIVALLDAGEDFAALAVERSQDPGSGASGGALGCAPAGQYVEPFEDAVFSQPVGEVGEPVETDFGFHVILVTERSTPTLEDVRADIESALTEQLDTAFNTWFTEALGTTEVVVDTRYGTWDPAQASVVRPITDGAVIVDSGEG